MRPLTYERLVLSPVAERLKRVLRARRPELAKRLRLGMHAARRAMREPAPRHPSDASLFWDPPPRLIELRPLRLGEASRRLCSQLQPSELEELDKRLDAVDRKRWDGATDAERQLLALHFVVHYDVPGVAERLGLTTAAPPLEVPALGRGSLAAGGSFGYADLVAELLREAGAPLSEHRRGLDFGCSAGRIVRVLAAAYPDIEWHACDTDELAVGWARDNLPGATFFVSEFWPPLPFEDGLLDLVYAISIWTHFSEAAALRWFEEMRRVLSPGGHLLVTSHGYRALELRSGGSVDWPRRLVAETATALYASGFHFISGYGRALSQVEATRDWGESFFTPEWLARHLTPRWSILHYEPGGIEQDHDVYVLERRR